MAQGVRMALDQGINLSDPRSDLLPGELRLARNCHYLPESSELAKVRGRALYGALGARATGLGFVRFRTKGRFLIASAGSSYYTGPVASSGSWTASATGLSSVGLMETAYYSGTDRLFVADGVNGLRSWSGSGSMRAAGLKTPAAATLTFLNNSATSYVNNATFQYCHTEVDTTTDADNPIESPPSAVQSLAASAASGTFKYALPALTNAAADTIRVYRTQHGGDVFYQIAEFVSTNDKYYDGDDTELLGTAWDNDNEWGFKTVDDLFLSTRPVLPMVGGPLTANYITVNSAAPIGDIMGIFDGSLYIAGVTAYPADLYFSQPDFPEMFSPVSFIREDEAITGTGVANDRLLTFTENTIHRLNTFPRTTDPGFGLGLATRELVTSDHGCVAKRTVVNFGVGQPNNRLFYLSTRGPMMTDGYETWPLNEDLDWSERLFNFDAMSGAVARNFPKYQQVWLFVPSASSPTNDMAFIYHYHPNHLKKGPVGKWTGPVHVRCAAAAVAYENNSESRLFTADTDASGNIYREDSGFVDAQNYDDASGAMAWEWESGDQPFAEESADKRIQRVFLSVVGTDTFQARLTYAMDKRDDENQVPLADVTNNVASTQTFGTSAVAASKTRTYRGGVWQTGSHVRWHMTETAVADRAVASLEAEVEPFGRQT